MDNQIYFNGVDGTRGGYWCEPMTVKELADSLRLRFGSLPPSPRAVISKIEDPSDLAQAGWGVIFAPDTDPAIREALSDLLELRQSQASAVDDRLYRELTFASTESKRTFLTRHGAGYGPVKPSTVPYYLMIVADPGTVPFSFQYQLDVQYGVGRICFDTIDEYAQYAESVVNAELEAPKRDRRVALFGVENRDDPLSRLCVEELVSRLATYVIEECSDWSLEAALRDAATKHQLEGLLGGDQTPALLFTGGHAVCFPLDDPLQVQRQGGLVCSDWPGPRSWQGPLPDDFFFTADDLGSDADLHGTVAMLLACFSGGTPRHDSYALRAAGREDLIARRSFVAALPKRMLAHPNGGSLAVIAHSDTAWEHSFYWKGAGSQITAYTSMLWDLLHGYPVGLATEHFGQRYGEIAADLSAIDLEVRESSNRPTDTELADLWRAQIDARSFVVLGDPAVRVRTRS
jgi:hypothetical protein